MLQRPCANAGAAGIQTGVRRPRRVPKVDGQTQKKRDDARRGILEKELADEQQQLEAARQKLAEQEAVRTGDERNYQRFLDRVQPFATPLRTTNATSKPSGARSRT